MGIINSKELKEAEQSMIDLENTLGVSNIPEVLLKVFQSNRRLINLIKLEQSTSNGKVCPNCHGIRVIHKGGSCFICATCGFDLGCGG